MIVTASAPEVSLARRPPDAPIFWGVERHVIATEPAQDSPRC
jgi:hypothetical protein